jgi:hypothetical protein
MASSVATFATDFCNKKSLQNQGPFCVAKVSNYATSYQLAFCNLSISTGTSFASDNPHQYRKRALAGRTSFPKAATLVMKLEE